MDKETRFNGTACPKRPCTPLVVNNHTFSHVLWGVAVKKKKTEKSELQIGLVFHAQSVSAQAEQRP